MFGGTLSLFSGYAYFATHYLKGVLPTPGDCAGSETAASFGCALLTSYLLLFINFYVQTYKKGSKAKLASKVNGHSKVKSVP